MPAAVSPLRGDERLFNYRERFHFLRLLFSREIAAGRVILSSLEKKLPQPNYTMNTLEALGKICPVKPALVVGGDQATNLSRWHRADELMQSFRFVVFARQGAIAPAVTGLDFEFIADFDEDISATNLREKLKALPLQERIAAARSLLISCT